MKYTIEWVGDKPHNYKNTNSYAVAGKDENGTEFKKTKLERPEGAVAPEKGEVFEGERIPHPRIDGAFLLSDDAAGGVGEARQNGSSSAAPSDKDDAISRAVAAKIAGRVLSYEVGNNIHGDKPLDLEAATARLAELTEAFLPIVTGAAEGKAEAPTTDRLDEGQPPF